MKRNITEAAFLARHSKKPKGDDKESVQYPGISDGGVELARERSIELQKLIEQSAAGAVVFIGGASDLERTVSTGEVFGDKLKELNKERKDIVVITKSEIEAMRENARGNGEKIINKISEIIENNPDKKIVVDFPLFLEELSMERSGWLKEDGSYGEYLLHLLKNNNNDEYESFREWVATKGGNNGPNPDDEASRYARAIKRPSNFTKKVVPNRPVIVGLVGHSWAADAMVVGLANNGKVDLEAFDRISGGSIIKETEIAKITYKDNDEPIIEYRGKKYNIRVLNI